MFKSSCRLLLLCNRRRRQILGIYSIAVTLPPAQYSLTMSHSGRNTSQRCKSSNSSSTSSCSISAVRDPISHPSSRLNLYLVYQHYVYKHFRALPHIGDCSGSEPAALFGCALLTSYLLLFVDFYVRTYGTSTSKVKVNGSSQTLVPNGTNHL